jgi:outer membrane biogenesis lipoprotein LolB
MKIRHLSAILILAIVLMGCATSQERPAVTRSEFDRRANELARQHESQHRQIDRHYQALDRMQAEQQWRENQAGR